MNQIEKKKDLNYVRNNFDPWNGVSNKLELAKMDY